MSTIIFFGAGRIGRSIVQEWVYNNTFPDYWVDNNNDLWGQELYGIKIDNPKIIETIDNPLVFITCKNHIEIESQLLSYGVLKENIIYGANTFVMHFHMWKKIRGSEVLSRPNNPIKNVIFDLEMGLALGGVESWSFETAAMLRKKGIRSLYLTSNVSARVVESEQRYLLEYIEQNDHKEKMNRIANKILQFEDVAVVCNFAGGTLLGACYTKCFYPDKVTVIAVVHSDSDGYYDSYYAMQEYIDYCFVISSKIEQKMVERGFPKEKIRLMPWAMSTNDILTHNYSDETQPIKLGYAGRIVKLEKRSDLLAKIAVELNKRNIDYVLKIAGSGPFEDEFDDIIKSNDLTNKVFRLGRINRDEIKEFWNSNDVMIGCSDVEGHSLTQVEAMSVGAIPVITDTSGARDDVTPGENGFVAEVGNYLEICNYIEYLYNNRALLPLYGQRAYQQIRDYNNEDHIMNVWNEIIKFEKNDYKVSVIVPICNTEQYLPQCLDSIINQTLKEIEIICINDGSADSCGEILNNYASKDSRIRVINKENTGYGNSMNIGISLAKGEYISIVESDDFAKPDMLESLYNKASSNRVDIIKCDYYSYMNGECTKQNSFIDFEEGTVFSIKDCWKLLNVNPTIWAGLYNRQFLQANNITFNETSGASYQDVSFSMIALYYAQRITISKDAFLCYRIDNPNASMKSPKKVFCIQGEFARIESLIQDDLFIEHIQPVKFRHYIGNYNRVHWLYKYAFLCSMQKELEKDFDKQNLSFWDPVSWENAERIRQNPDDYFERTEGYNKALNII